LHSPLKSLLGTTKLGFDGSNWETGNTSNTNWETSISGNTGTKWETSSSISSTDCETSGNRLGSITNMLDRLLNTNGNLLNSVEGSVDGSGHLLDGVSTGLMNKGLADGLVSTDRSRDHLATKGGDVLEDGLGNMGGLDNRSRLVGSNGGGDVGVGSLSNGVGQGGDLGDNLSEGMSLSGGVGKVTTKSVVLNGGRVMGRGPDKIRGSSNGASNGSSYRGHSHGSSTAKGDQSGEKQEGIHDGGC